MFEYGIKCTIYYLNPILTQSIFPSLKIKKRIEFKTVYVVD
jgi:hypothetical protein